MLVVSPHFDDAALSLGGAIARAAARGERPCIINVFAGVGRAGAAAGPLARALHAEWGFEGRSPRAVVAERRREDGLAAETLGARVLYLPFADAVYRIPRLREVRRLFDTTRPLDQVLVRAIARRIEAAWMKEGRPPVYLPLAIGDHLDHRQCAAVAESLIRRGADVYAYEDLPYAIDAVPLELAPSGLEAIAIDVTDTFEEKLTALACYASQVATLFPGGSMRSELRAYAARVSKKRGRLAERVWRPVRQSRTVPS